MRKAKTARTREEIGRRTGLACIACNLLLGIAKLIVGLVSGMVSVTADAVNNLSDAASGLVGVLGFALSARPADDRHPFGHGRYEYLAGLTVAFLVMVAGVELFKSGVDKLLHPQAPSQLSVPLFIVLALSILVKLAMAIFCRSIGKRLASPVLTATADDARNDCVATGAVLLSAVIFAVTGFDPDGIMALLVALFVLFSGIGLVRRTIDPLLGATPDEEEVRRIEQKILGYPGVLGAHDLMLHSYGAEARFASVHVEMAAAADVMESHALLDRIERDFLAEGLHMVIHCDPIPVGETGGALRCYLTEQAQAVDARITLHDVCVLPGENGRRVCFDCVLPRECEIPEEALKEELQRRLSVRYPDCTADIRIDHSFVSMS